MIAFFVTAYCLIGLLVARKVYSAMRAKEIRQSGPDRFDGEIATLLAVLGVFAGAMWPAAILIGAIIYKPAKAPEELKAERDAMARRIHELENELGMKSTP